MEYLPYGEMWFEEGDANNAPKYNSQELDKETGYYFYNARHYDPEISRFVTADNVVDGELDSQGWNRFSYVKGNPIIYKDPTGHTSILYKLFGIGDKNERFDDFCTDMKEQLVKNTSTLEGDQESSLARKSFIEYKGKRIDFDFTKTFCKQWNSNGNSRSPEKVIQSMDKNVLGTLILSSLQSDIKAIKIEGFGTPKQAQMKGGPDDHAQKLGWNQLNTSWGIDVTGLKFKGDKKYYVPGASDKENYKKYNNFISNLKTNSENLLNKSDTIHILDQDRLRSWTKKGEWSDGSTPDGNIHKEEPHLHYSGRPNLSKLLFYPSTGVSFEKKLLDYVNENK